MVTIPVLCPVILLLYILHAEADGGAAIEAGPEEQELGVHSAVGPPGAYQPLPEGRYRTRREGCRNGCIVFIFTFRPFPHVAAGVIKAVGAAPPVGAHRHGADAAEAHFVIELFQGHSRLPWPRAAIRPQWAGVCCPVRVGSGIVQIHIDHGQVGNFGMTPLGQWRKKFSGCFGW